MAIYFEEPLSHTLRGASRASHTVCLKVTRADGQELSLSGDNSCGAFPTLSRVSLARFESAVSNRRTAPDVEWPTEEDFLRALADFFGYDLVKKPG